MDERRMGGWKAGWPDGKGSMEGWWGCVMVGGRDGRMGRWIDGWVIEWMVGWMDAGIGGWMGKK